jgi:hypothetical protein
VIVTLVEIRREDGRWLTLNQNTVYDFGESSKYSPCSALAPGASLEVRRTMTFISVPHSSLVGAEPTVRISFIAPCVEAGGSLALPSAVSEPFALDIRSPAKLASNRTSGSESADAGTRGTANSQPN